MPHKRKLSKRSLAKRQMEELRQIGLKLSKLRNQAQRMHGRGIPNWGKVAIKLSAAHEEVDKANSAVFDVE
jgi:hypothetical protein